jgi:peptide/nickel transport system permease protein
MQDSEVAQSGSAQPLLGQEPCEPGPVAPGQVHRTGAVRRLAASLRRSRSAAIGVAILAFWVLVAVAAPVIAPYPPNEMAGGSLERPSPAHWLGTDNLGRDTLSRLFWGTRVAIYLAPAAVLVGMMIGITLGLVSGYSGGGVDVLIMRATDVLISFPMLLIYILIIVAVGPSALNVVLAVAVGAIPAVTRIVRGLVLETRTQDYISAARLRGERRFHILFREILPNVIQPVIVDACIRVGYAVMSIGALGFLGLGPPPPTADWGRMINEGREWMLQMPWVVVAPALALSSVVIGLNLLSDGISETAHRR